MTSQGDNSFLDQKTDEMVEALGFGDRVVIWVSNSSMNQREKLVREYSLQFNCQAKPGTMGTFEGRLAPSLVVEFPPDVQKKCEAVDCCGIYVTLRAWVRWFLDVNKGIVDLNSPDIVDVLRSQLKSVEAL